MSGQAMHEQFAAIRTSKQNESMTMCILCKKEFTQQNPESKVKGHCTECEAAGKAC